MYLKNEPYSCTKIYIILATASRGDLPALQRILRDGADIDTRGLFKDIAEGEGEEQTMLEVAASHRQLDIMEYLIPQGADVN